MLQDAYRKAGVLDRTLFVLTADHGMMPLYHKVDANTLANAVTKAGTSLVEQTYSSGVYLWLKDASRAGQAAQNIVNLRNPYIQSVYVMKRSAKGYAYYRVSSAALLRTAGVEAANQALLQSFAGPNGPDVVVLFAEGAGSEPGGQASWKADHGGASWQAQHIPLVFSGPGVRSGQVSSYPARLMDIAPTALQLMGVPHKGMQGIPLADAMQAPPAWAVRWQQGRNRYLLPHVQALQQESRLELAARL
jgi:arylsulfatase A-like enzyme